MMMERIGADPFKGRIKDCRDCDFAEKVAPYNKLTLAKAIAELLVKLETDPQRAAEYHYLLGNAYYNMTYYGNAAEATMYSRNPNFMWYNYGYGRDSHREEDMPYFLDCSLAQEHYDTAMKLADASGDLELASKCCFMAAKCEQNTYNVTIAGNDPKDSIRYSQFRKYFSRLRDIYDSTKFYGQAIKECKYFNYFVSVSN